MADPKLRVVITVDGKEYLATIDKAAKQTGELGKSSKQSAAEVSHLAGQMKALYGALAAYGVLSAVRNVVAINAEFEKLNASLVTVTGSTVAADHAFGLIEKFATTTPYQLQEVVSAFIKLKSLGLDASEDSLRSYGNTASAMGKSLDQMIEAVADAATGEFERLKEFGIKASVQGNNVSLRFKGVTTTVKNSAENITAYLQRLGDTDFAGGMARQMDTLGGRFSNLGDASGALARSIGKAGLNDLMKDLTDEMIGATVAIDAFVKDPTKLPDWAKVGAFALFKLKQEFVDLGDVIGATAAILDLKIGPGFFDRLDIILEERQRKREALEQESQRFVATLEGIGRVESAAAAAPPPAPAPRPRGDGGDGGDSAKTDFEAAQAYGKYMYELARQAYPEATKSAEEYGDEMARLVVEQHKAERSGWIERMAAAERTTKESATAVEIFADEVLRLNAQFTAGDISVETYERSITSARETMDGFGKAGKETMGELTAAVKGWGDEFTNTMADAVMNGRISFKDLADSIIRDLLRISIYQSITQPLFNSIFPGSIPAPVKHAGGSVGGAGTTRNISPWAFAGAPRYHSGGMVGLKPGEVPIIAQQGETVIPRGGISVPAPIIEINNYTGAQVRQEESSVDGRQMLRLFIGEAAADVRRGGELGAAITQSFGLRRPGARVS